MPKQHGMVFEVRMTLEEFCLRHWEGLEGVGMAMAEGERAEQARTAVELGERDCSNVNVRFVHA